MGGTPIVLGEDYGEGGVVAQERSHAYALKSLIWLLDPRPSLPKIVEMVERGFELSEASNTPVMMELRIRACHVRGSFVTKENQAPAVSTRHKLDGPPKEFIYDRLAHPPAIFRQEKLKCDVRLPAARKFIVEHQLNEVFPGAESSLGIIVQGGLYKGLLRAPHLDLSRGQQWLDSVGGTKQRAAELLDILPARPPTFCVGCPERPVFSAMKLVAQDIGRPHVAMDVGCHCFGSFEPFSQGNTLLGYGMSLASAAGVSPMSSRRPVAIMGDGGFWHNGLLSGVASNLLNKGDGVLIVMKNGYASATGTQELLSTPPEETRKRAVGASAVHAGRSIERALAGLGVKWLRTVNNYRVSEMAKAYREAMTTDEKGLKVIVAEGEW